MSTYFTPDTCPCGHRWEDHCNGMGCLVGYEGWIEDTEDPSNQGCECLVAHADLSFRDERAARKGTETGQ